MCVPPHLAKAEAFNFHRLSESSDKIFKNVVPGLCDPVSVINWPQMVPKTSFKSSNSTR